MGGEGRGGKKIHSSIYLNIRCWGDGWEGEAGGLIKRRLETS